jgi:hypothetical protein
LKNLIQLIRRDQNIHRSFAVLSIHESFDFFMYQAVAYVGTWWFGLIAWSISFVTGIFMGHWAIEKHDKHDHGDTHETWEDGKILISPPAYCAPFQQLKLEKEKE